MLITYVTFETKVQINIYRTVSLNSVCFQASSF